MKQIRKEGDAVPKNLLLNWDKSRVFANPAAKGAERLNARLAEEMGARLIRPLGVAEMDMLREAALGRRNASNVSIITGCKVDEVIETIQLIDRPLKNGLYYRRKDYRRLFIAVEKVSVSGLSYCYMACVGRSRKKETPAHAEDQECCI